MKLTSDNTKDVEVEDSWHDECPQCGYTNVQCYYIPSWAATRCYGCLADEAVKFNYKIQDN